MDFVDICSFILLHMSGYFALCVRILGIWSIYVKKSKENSNVVKLILL